MYSLKCLRVSTEISTHTYWNEYDVLTETSTTYWLNRVHALTAEQANQNNKVIDWWRKRRWALKGRHFFIAQGVSPGLVVSTHFFELRRSGTTPKQVPQYSRCECRSYRAFNFCVPCLPRVSYRALPSFPPGLCRSVVPKGTRN